MRIPPSAIVLPLILAVPFGFAIRDSVKGNDPASEEEKATKEVAAREAREHEEELAAERDQYERAKKVEKERHEALALLIGHEPAAMGAGVHQLDKLDELIVDPTLERFLTDRAIVTGRDGSLVSAAFTIDGDACSALREIVTSTWGPGTSLQSDDDSTVWIDAANHRRAAIRTANLVCVLDFTRTVEVAAWVEAALPKVLGKTLPQAEKVLGTRPNPEMPAWYLAGPPSGHDATTLTAQIEGDKLTGTNASASVSDDDAAAIIKAVAKKLGTQPVHDVDQWSWDDGHFTITYYAPTLNLFHQQ